MTSLLVACCALLATSDEMYSTWQAEAAAGDQLPANVAQKLSGEELAALKTGEPILPFEDVTVGLRGADGGTWVGSARGLQYLAPGAPRWQVFQSRRWLPDNRVQDLSLTETGAIVVKTEEGLGQLVPGKTTLAAKMDRINVLLQKYHVRDGFICHARLKEPGRLETAELEESNDNDGLWSCLYLAAEAFRYGATGDAGAKQNARRTLEAMMFLERITGRPGFVARSVIPIGADPRRHRGEWYRSADNQWWWKGDTSSDELVGHYFAYAVYYDLVADAREKQEIRGYVERITDHILDHGLNYVGPPGVPTTWGVWAPEVLNKDLRRIGDRGLNSLEILSHLKVAEHISGKPRYTEKLRELVEKHSYAINTVLQKQVWPPQFINHSDDELAFGAYYPLLIYERDPKLRTIYLASIRRSWMIERPERSPLFNLIYGAALQASTWTDPSKRPDRAYVDGADYDRQECLEWFRDVPEDTIMWDVDNRGRRDVKISGDNRFRRPRAETALPVSERHTMRWNGDPYTLEGGSGGRARDDGSPILLPYWMGRYHRLID